MRGCVQRRDVVRLTREVQCEGAVVAEAIEGASARDAADERAILALVEERARLLSLPRSGEVAHAVLVHFDLVGHLAVQEFDVRGESFLHAQRDVIAREDAGGRGERAEREDDLLAEVLESCAHELHDEPLVVAVDDQGRDAVALAVHEAIGVGVLLESGAPGDGAGEGALPPGGIDGSLGVGVEEAEGDFGAGAPEGGAEWLAALVGDVDGAGVTVGAFEDVAAVDPGMAGGPAACALVGDDGGKHVGR